MDGARLDIFSYADNVALAELLGDDEEYGHTIDCSANPYDLRPAAEAILTRALDMLSQRTNDKPVVILMGECHIASAHIALQQMVAQSLKESEQNFMVGVELPHNAWSVIARDDMDIDVPDGLYYSPNDLDDGGQASLTAYLSHDGTDGAPVAHQNLYSYFLNNRIPTFFNDAAKTKAGLDMNDPLMVHEEIVVQPKDIAGAMKARNKIMASLGDKYAKATGADIILQTTGMAHILGDEADHSSPDDSLMAAYEKAGFHVLPVFVNSEFNMKVPKEAADKLSAAITAKGLATDMFLVMEEEEEEDFLLQLSEQSGGELVVYDTLDEVDKCRETVKAISAMLVEKYRGSVAQTQDGPSIPEF